MVKRQRKRGFGTCAYCGQTRNVTPDHVPPKNLFAPPRTSDLITVPCCDQCNEGTSKDDEYLRIAFALRAEARRHPSMITLLPDIDKGLSRSEAGGLAAKVAQRTTRRVVTFPGGVVLPCTVHEIDFLALSRVLERISRGLFFSDTGAPLPPEHYILTAPEYNDGMLNDDKIQYFVASVSRQPVYQVGRGEFAYQGARWPPRPDDDGEIVAFLLTFYERIKFLTLIAKGETMAKAVLKYQRGPEPETL